MNIPKRLLALLLLVPSLPVFAQVTPTTVIVLTNLPAWYTTNYTTNLFTPGTTPTTNIISLRQGQGMAVAVSFTGTNASATAGFVINWAVSLDGTNYQTANFLSFSNSVNGTSGVVGYTNFPGALLNNALYITPATIQNTCTPGSAGVTLSSVECSFGNIVPGGYP
ncbi:MAG TPA: hypothetical protein VFC44_00920 [Candidatus Saccharimonadales bacterium]|nr:hypothetical protein [Candidatus Saccharimonadales bacterium]